MERIKSVLYARVSSTKSDQTTSYDMQQEYKNENFEIIEVYGERATGRYLYKRPIMKKMLFDAGIEIQFSNTKQPIFSLLDKEPKFKNIIVANTSRFGRNLIEVKQIIELLHKKGVSVYFDDLGKFSNSKDIDLTLDLLFLLDENTSREISKKVNNGLKRARKEKEYLHVNSTFFGMEYIKEKNILVANDESKIIINIFNDYKKGLSTRQIAIKYSLKPDRILDILNNPRYAGYNFYNRYEKNSKKKKRIDEVEIFKTDKIEPLISIDLWRECQKIKASKRLGDRGVNNKTYSLTSKIICEKCGGKFYHKSKNKKPNSDMWKCIAAHNNSSICDMAGISEKTIIKHLKSLIGIDGIKNGLEAKINIAIDNISISNKKVLEKKIKPIENILDRLKKLYLYGDITEEEYIEEKTKFIDEYNNLKIKIKEIENKEESIRKLEVLKKDYLKILDEYKVLLKDNPQELFKKIEYIKVGMVNNILKPNKKKAVVREVFFKDFEPIKEYYGAIL